MQVAVPTYRDALEFFQRMKRRPFKLNPPGSVPLSSVAARVLAELGAGALAADFILPSGAALKRAYKYSDYPSAELGARWSVIGVSGAGDLWLSSLQDQAGGIAFLDHDQESRAVPRPIGIGPEAWVVVALLFRMFEDAERAARRSPSSRAALRRLARETNRALNAISPGLVRRLPYQLSD